MIKKRVRPNRTVIRPNGMTEAEYKAIHFWIGHRRGKPSCCEICGTTKANSYDWANLSGTYKWELDDWRRLCKSCHMREKNPGMCKHGHQMTPDNTYIRPSRPTENACRECNRMWDRERRQRRETMGG